MALTTRMARITGPIAYRAGGGRPSKIPLGPCLVQQRDEHWVELVWGATGQNSAALPLEEVETAEQSGHLVLLD